MLQGKVLFSNAGPAAAVRGAEITKGSNSKAEHKYFFRSPQEPVIFYHSSTDLPVDTKKIIS